MQSIKRIQIIATAFAIVTVAISHVAAQELQKTNDVQIQLIDGRKLDVTISEIKNDGTVVGRNVPSKLKLDQILEIRTGKTSAEMREGQIRIRMVDGGIILANSCQIADEKVSFSSSIGIDTLPLESVAAVIWNLTDKVKQTLNKRSTDNDTVVVSTESGERLVPGILNSSDEEKIKINYKGKSRNISFDKVQVNAIIIADVQLKKIKGTVAEIELSDGSKLKGLIDSFNDKTITAKFTGGHSVRLDRAKLVSIKITSGSLVYLSDLEPSDVQQRAMFSVQRHWKRDLSVQGNPMTLKYKASNKPKSFRKGIGTQSYSEITFQNNEEYSRFQAVAGIDAETKGRGDCKMIVRGDGVYLWSKRIQAKENPVDVSVDISGVKEVSLIVQTGEQFDLADHANWANARFTKSK